MHSSFVKLLYVNVAVLFKWDFHISPMPVSGNENGATLESLILAYYILLQSCSGSIERVRWIYFYFGTYLGLWMSAWEFVSLRASNKFSPAQFTVPEGHIYTLLFPSLRASHQSEPSTAAMHLSLCTLLFGTAGSIIVLGKELFNWSLHFFFF